MAEQSNSATPQRRSRLGLLIMAGFIGFFGFMSIAVLYASGMTNENLICWLSTGLMAGPRPPVMERLDDARLMAVKDKVKAKPMFLEAWRDADGSSVTEHWRTQVRCAVCQFLLQNKDFDEFLQYVDPAIASCKHSKEFDKWVDYLESSKLMLKHQ